MCAIVGFSSFRDLRLRLSSNLAYITSVFIGYIGTDSIGSFTKRASLLKKPEKMVEINNRNVRRSSICWRGRISDNGRQKTRNHGYDVIVGGELFTDYSDHPRKTVTPNPKLKINRRRTLPASFPLAGCLPQAAWPERLLSEKSGRCIAADWRAAFTYD